jgi:hypothetical protein
MKLPLAKRVEKEKKDDISLSVKKKDILKPLFQGTCN